MKNLRWLSWRLLAVTSLIIAGSVTLNSCGKKPDRETNSTALAATISTETKVDRSSESRLESKVEEAHVKSSVPAPQKPQLIKTAELSLRLELIDKTVLQLRQIVKSKHGVWGQIWYWDYYGCYRLYHLWRSGLVGFIMLSVNGGSLYQ